MFKIGNRRVESWPVRGFDTVETLGFPARYLSSVVGSIGLPSSIGIICKEIGLIWMGAYINLFR